MFVYLGCTESLGSNTHTDSGVEQLGAVSYPSCLGHEERVDPGHLQGLNGVFFDSVLYNTLEMYSIAKCIQTKAK